MQITHDAATQVGLTVTTELVAAQRRLVTFAFTSHDGVGQAGNGRHTGALVAHGRFAHILAAKQARAG